jgi:tetratricopeptide (TPR) repeat protein
MMDAAHVCELVGVVPETLHRWELLGLVRSTDGRYDFRDLVSLQTIAALVAQGASPHTIASSVRALARVVPGTDRPLAQLKLLADQDTLVAEVNGCLMAPGGQLLMRFGPDEGDEIDARAALTLPHAGPCAAGRSAEEWFDIGCLHEDAGELEQAERAYREALALQPCSVEAHFNLANVLRATNRREAAEERYRVTIEHDPGMAEAWFNLADLLDESGRCEEAIEGLRAAVCCAPNYADAHYNLAVCCDKAGLSDEARTHWREYVRLDPASEWAAFARGRLSG